MLWLTCGSNSPLIRAEAHSVVPLANVCLSVYLVPGSVPSVEDTGMNGIVSIPKSNSELLASQMWRGDLWNNVKHKHAGVTQDCQQSCSAWRKGCPCSIWKFAEICFYLVELWLPRFLFHCPNGWASPRCQPLHQDWRCWEEQDTTSAFHLVRKIHMKPNPCSNGVK